MTYGYTVAPMPDNPITDYLNEQFNADITFTDVPKQPTQKVATSPSTSPTSHQITRTSCNCTTKAAKR